MEHTLQWKTRTCSPAKPACTLLIPAAIEAYLQRRYPQRGPVIAYLAYLLGKAGLYRAQGRLPVFARVTRKYQADRQSLQRWHVRIPGELWTELRCLAGACGVTMTHMFVILIRLDQEDQKRKWNDRGPTFFGYRIRFFQSVGVRDGLTRRLASFVITDRPPPRLLKLIEGHARKRRRGKT